MIENLFLDKLQIEANCHDGQGNILSYRAFNQSNSRFQVDFIDLAVIPPGTSIGNHLHGNNMETYLILHGNGMMRFENKDIQVKRGDILVNQPFGEHGLINNSLEEIFVLIFEVKKKECGDQNDDCNIHDSKQATS